MKAAMKPWTERRQVAEALANAHVAIGERVLDGGVVMRGLYAGKDFAADDYVASFHGEVIPRAQLWELGKTDPARFDLISDYALLTGKSDHLMPTDLGAVGAHLINHSCGPNVKWASFERGARLVRAIKPIARGEELTVHYGWLGIRAMMAEKWTRCACAAPYCAGYVELKLEMDWADEERHIGGPRVPEEEVANRFLADMANDTDENEALLRSFATVDLPAMIHGAKNTAPFDFDAYFAKLRIGVVTALLAVRRTGVAVSESRVRELRRRYDLPAEVQP